MNLDFAHCQLPFASTADQYSNPETLVVEPQRLGAAEPQPKCERPLNRRDAMSAEKTAREKTLLEMRDSFRLHCDEHRERQGRAYLPCASTAQLALGRRSACKDPRRADITVHSKLGNLPGSGRLWSWGASVRYCGQECPRATTFTALLLCAHRGSAVKSALGKSAPVATSSRDGERLKRRVTCLPPL